MCFRAPSIPNLPAPPAPPPTLSDPRVIAATQAARGRLDRRTGYSSLLTAKSTSAIRPPLPTTQTAKTILGS